MGLFDIPAPLLAWLDHVLSGVAGPAVRLAFWAIAGAVLSMAMYWVLSPQKQIAHVKAKAAEARRMLGTYDGDFGGAWPLIRASLWLALRQLGLVTWPVVLASLPVLCLVAWLSSAYGHAFPSPGMEVGIRSYPVPLRAQLMGGADPTPGPAAPQQPFRVVLADDAGQVVADVPLPAPVPVVHKRQWWNVLFGNPAGYLPDDARIERIEIALPQKEYLPIGPPALRSWHGVFFATLLACSLALKLAFRIQ